MISWRCVTFRREKYLPNIVRCFLQQDCKEDMEFVIINDDTCTEYICDHPDIRIYNLDYKFENVIKKMEYGNDLCAGEILMPVDDDDELKPWATSMMYNNLKGGRFITFEGYFKKIADDKLLWRDEIIAGMWMCEKSLYEEIGRNNIGHSNFMEKVKSAGHFRSFKCNEDNAFFVWDRTSDRSNWGKKTILIGGDND